MTDLPSWERPLLEPGGYAPQLLFIIPGDFSDDLRLDPAREYAKLARAAFGRRSERLDEQAEGQLLLLAQMTR